jgi:hypothetical protein
MTLSDFVNVPVLKSPLNWALVAFVVVMLLFAGHLLFSGDFNPNAVNNVQETN